MSFFTFVAQYNAERLHVYEHLDGPHVAAVETERHCPRGAHCTVSAVVFGVSSLFAVCLVTACWAWSWPKIPGIRLWRREGAF